MSINYDQTDEYLKGREFLFKASFDPVTRNLAMTWDVGPGIRDHVQRKGEQLTEEQVIARALAFWARFLERRATTDKAGQAS